MSKILVKGIMLKDQGSGWGDHPGPIDFHVAGTYKSIDEYLRKNGQSIVSEMIDPLPFIGEGFITPSIAGSLYVINNCLITNRFKPWFGLGANVVHIIQGVSRLEDKLKIDETLNFLKIKARGIWTKYWENFQEEEIINVPEQLSDVNKLIAYIPKLRELVDSTLILPTKMCKNKIGYYKEIS